jgi:hypothetical protein
MFDKIFARKPDKPIFHYTSQKGLLGIIKTKGLWLTHIYCLNDSTEITHAFNLMKSLIESYIESDALLEDRSLYIYLKELMEDVSKNIQRFNLFVFSFSENGDLLSQWRGYCSSGGYSIGFDYEVLEKFLITGDDLPIEVELGKCIYEPSEHKQILTEILNKSVPELKRYIEIEQNPPIALGGKIPKFPSEYKDALADFLLSLLKIAPFIKNESFKEEQEWRLIATIADKYDVQFREGSKWIIPYYELALFKDDENLQFREVILGPTIDGNTAMQSLKRLLGALDIKCKVIPSKIPYRE